MNPKVVPRQCSRNCFGNTRGTDRELLKRKIVNKLAASKERPALDVIYSAVNRSYLSRNPILTVPNAVPRYQRIRPSSMSG
jgi:hypothetical protein